MRLILALMLAVVVAPGAGAQQPDAEALRSVVEAINSNTAATEAAARTMAAVENELKALRAAVDKLGKAAADRPSFVTFTPETLGAWPGEFSCNASSRTGSLQCEPDPPSATEVCKKLGGKLMAAPLNKSGTVANRYLFKSITCHF
ncbi:MAG: hypothetical protein JO055_14650 [Alphaproteobacteria bacterium]|nr:hypothetical protein [Alphaproteobacteria bacterium]